MDDIKIRAIRGRKQCVNCGRLTSFIIVPFGYICNECSKKLYNCVVSEEYNRRVRDKRK